MDTLQKKKKGIVLGGDLRQVHLANLLSRDMDITAVGICEGREMLSDDIQSFCIDEIGFQPDYLFLPMPAANGEFINAPLTEEKLHITDTVALAGAGTTVFAGKIDTYLKETLEDYDVHYHDYLKREELVVWNALATAEGALELILSELPVTVFRSNIMIVGGGRISRALRKILRALGARVSVSARRPSDLAWIGVDGCDAVPIRELGNRMAEYDVVINTVPAKILDESILSVMKSQALLIDLASKPGGVDFGEANRLGIKTIWALSLPGKTAPISSGEIIYSTITNIIEEETHGKD